MLGDPPLIGVTRGAGRGQKMSANTIPSKRESAPPALVNSTLALFPVLGGFFAQNLMVTGELNPSTLMILVFAIQNLCLCYFWRRLNSVFVKNATLIVIIAFQWGYIAATICALYFDLPAAGAYASLLSLGMVSGALVLFLARLGWERSGSAAAFAVLGLVGMSAVVWRGIEDWVVAVNALSGKKMASIASEHQNIAPKDRREHSSALDLAQGHDSHWGYSGEEGPDMWGSMKEEFRVCSTGVSQSPVDIPKKTQKLKNDIHLDWQSEKGSVVNNGHTIQVNLPGRSRALIAGQSYTLKQFHIHTPSEHQVSGLSYPMEVHFVHSTSEGRLAVLGVFVEIGSPSQEFGKIMPYMPAKSDSPATETSLLNLASIVPKDLSVFRYSGSLTTPPCSEGVLWSVLSEPVEMSTDQVTAFRRLFSINARPVQPLGARAFEGRVPALAH